MVFRCSVRTPGLPTGPWWAHQIAPVLSHVESGWTFVHSGYFDNPMEDYAAGVRESIEFAREEAAYQRAEEGRDDWAGPD